MIIELHFLRQIVPFYLHKIRQLLVMAGFSRLATWLTNACSVVIQTVPPLTPHACAVSVPLGTPGCP